MLTRRQIRVRTIAYALVPLASGPLASTVSQAQRIQYPPTAKVDTVDDYHGTKVRDPYRWLEAIESPAVANWIKNQNAVTMPYLEALPGRDIFKNRITALYNYARTSAPFFEGGRWFYVKNSGLQRQSVWYSARTLDGAEELVIDPNVLSPDGSVALSGFIPSPDGKVFAYGQSEGGSDWVTFYVRDFATKQNTADTIRWSKFGGPSWTARRQRLLLLALPDASQGRRAQGEARTSRAVLSPPRYAAVRGRQRSTNARTIRAGSCSAGRTKRGSTYSFSPRAAPTRTSCTSPTSATRCDPNVSAPIRPVVTGHDGELFPVRRRQRPAVSPDRQGRAAAKDRIRRPWQPRSRRTGRR